MIAMRPTGAATPASLHPRRRKAVDNDGLRYGAMESALRPSLPTATPTGCLAQPIAIILRRPKSTPA